MKQEKRSILKSYGKGSNKDVFTKKVPLKKGGTNKLITYRNK